MAFFTNFFLIMLEVVGLDTIYGGGGGPLFTHEELGCDCRFIFYIL